MLKSRWKREDDIWVSMESGLEGRNNRQGALKEIRTSPVSMESGLEGRNNSSVSGK